MSQNLHPRMFWEKCFFSCVLPAAVTLLLSMLMLGFFSCAQIVDPSGGPEDLTPPKLDTLHSTRNFQTHFKKQDIVLAFDEWVELRDVFNQVIVSPPLEFRPEIRRKKKSVVLEFNEQEVLRDSATYVINYGEAIRDITKGNVASIVFVFSTGSYIDSLSVKGRIVDAYTAQPVKDVLFMLYENLADSVVRKERPFYFAKTDTAGRFQVNNVKADTFKAFALLDKNLNYRYDSDAESIGFPDSPLVLSLMKVEADSLLLDTLRDEGSLTDTLQLDSLTENNLPLDSLLLDSIKAKPTQNIPVVNIRLFSEDKRLFLRDKNVSSYGRVNLGFNRAPVDATVDFDSVGQVVYTEVEKDSFWLWYNLEADSPWNIYVRRDTSIDTVLVKSGLRESFFATANLISTDKIQPKPPLQHPFEPYRVSFNHPLAQIATDSVFLLEDSVKSFVRPRILLDTLSRRKLLIDFDWKQGRPYELVLIPGSITDMYGLANRDTIIRKFTVGQEKDFGSLTLKVNDLSQDLAYVIRILSKSGTLFREFKVQGVGDFQQSLPLMTPDTYTVELIEDLDRNGRWTTGNYDLHRQPERVQRKVLEELRANWEVEATMEAIFP